MGLIISPNHEPLGTLGATTLFVVLCHATVYGTIVGAFLAAKVIRQHEVQTFAEVAADLPERARTVVASLRTRARRLRVNAVVSLGLMIGALAVGLMLFYKAEDISDAPTARLLEQIERHHIETNNAQTKLRELTEGTVRRAQLAAAPEKGKSHYVEQREERFRAALAEEVADANSAIAAATRDIQARTATVQKHVLALNNADRTRRLVSVIATRVGAVLILVFLVQILASLYRYNVRLAAYYESRADSLELAIRPDGSVDDVRLQAAAAVIAPERIEFGREPKSPLETGADLAEAILAAHSAGLKKTQGRKPGGA